MKRNPSGARILLKETRTPERFGVPAFEGERIVKIEEKPSQPASSFAVTGVYFYDSSVFKKIHELKPSGRGELEITDVNSAYLREGTLTHSFLEGWWTDAGTFESLRTATNLVAETAIKMKAQGAMSTEPVFAATAARSTP